MYVEWHQARPDWLTLAPSSGMAMGLPVAVVPLKSVRALANHTFTTTNRNLIAQSTPKYFHLNTPYLPSCKFTQHQKHFKTWVIFKSKEIRFHSATGMLPLSPTLVLGNISDPLNLFIAQCYFLCSVDRGTRQDYTYTVIAAWGINSPIVHTGYKLACCR